MGPHSRRGDTYIARDSVIFRVNWERWLLSSINNIFDSSNVILFTYVLVLFWILFLISQVYENNLIVFPLAFDKGVFSVIYFLRARCSVLSESIVNYPLQQISAIYLLVSLHLIAFDDTNLKSQKIGVKLKISHLLIKDNLCTSSKEVTANL